MDREKKSGSKRGLNKVKAPPFPSGDFIALGSKNARPGGDSQDVKVQSKASSSDRKREGTSPSSSVPSKKSKLSVGTPPVTRAQPKKEVGDTWDAVAVEVDSSELLLKILEAEDTNDDERVEALLCGAVKQLRGSRAKPEAALFLTLMYLAKTRPLMFCTEIVVEAFCSLLKREVSVNFKTKGNNFVSVLSTNVLLAAYHDEGSWPEEFVKVFIEDSLGDRVWVDSEDCKGFVDNVLTSFDTIMPPRSMMAPELSFKPDACPSPPTASNPEEDEVASFGLECRENLENISVLPRFKHSKDSLELHVLEIIRDQLARRQPTEISRNMLRLLVSASGVSEVRLIVAQKLEIWLQNPKLTRPAQDLLSAVCLNCNQHNQQDVEVISQLIKIRMKTKPVVNHYLQCIKELLNQHPDNLGTVMKHSIYNELSNARNPNNMQLLMVIFQHSPHKSAKVLADVFQELLTNRDDYLRALRALLREIVRTVRHDLNYVAFCLGLMQDKRDFRDLDAQIKERLLLGITDLVVLATFLGISPCVREASASAARGDKKDTSALRVYQKQTANIQRDSVWWLHTIVPKTFKPGRNEFIHSLHKVLFMEQVEYYYNKDNWPTEGERTMMLRIASEVPLLEDTLMRILVIGLSRDHPLNAPDALELADQLVKRAAAVDMDDEPVLKVDRQELFEVVFNLCAYHHPENITFPEGYQVPSLAIAELYWKAWIMLLVVVAHNPVSFGQVAWQRYPTLCAIMEMCITNHFSFPPPTAASGERADEICNRELQIGQLEKQEILEFESHLAAASTKVAITESNSLLLSKLVTMDPIGAARKPPAAILDQVKALNQSLKLGHFLCRSRKPDFLLDIIQRQGTSQSMPWLAELVESSEGSFSLLPVQCLCEFLLNDAADPDSGEDTRKRSKQAQLLQHLQGLLREDPQATEEVLDYFMRRLASQQLASRLQAAKGLNLVLAADESDDEEEEEEDKQPEMEHAWLLKYLPQLPHFEAIRAAASTSLRQACQVESDASAVAAYVQFLSVHAPDESLQDVALDLAQLIVERPTVVNCIVPFTGGRSSFLAAMAGIFVKYLRKARTPSRDSYSWSESQGHILVQWGSGEAATMHILVVHAMVILLTYGPPVVASERLVFYELLDNWFPADGDHPQAFLVDTSEEALLLPDWLKLRMIRSSVDVLVDAALKDLDASQLVLFVQSFGIPVPNMSKLLHALDLVSEFESEAVDQAIVDKSYMAQLVKVQHQRGAQGGHVFSHLLGGQDPETEMIVEEVAVPATVIQKAPARPTRPVTPSDVYNTVVRLFGMSQKSVAGRVQRDLFRSLQKAILLNSAETTLQFVQACRALLEGLQSKKFVQELHKKSCYAAPLFKLITTNQGGESVLHLCQDLTKHSGSIKSSLSSVVAQYLKNHSPPARRAGEVPAGQVLTTEAIVRAITDVEENEPDRMEEVVKDLVCVGLGQGNVQPLISAMTSMLVKAMATPKSIGSKMQMARYRIFVDWIAHLEPEVVHSVPDLQQQLLFGNRDALTSNVPFRPYFLALLTHQAGWDTLQRCTRLLLSSSRFDATSTLDFLWACIHIPKIWQGRDKRLPKHHKPEPVLVLDSSQLVHVVEYMLREAETECTTVAWRLPLLLRCCPQRSLLETAVQHLQEVVKSQSEERCVVARQLLVQIYLQVPSVLLSVPPSITDGGQSGHSKADSMSHTILTCLAATDSSKQCSSRIADAELACRKLAAMHPLLLLRQLPMMAALLQGRANLEYAVFRSRHHMAFFSALLGLLELLAPSVFMPEHQTSLGQLVHGYIELFQQHASHGSDLLTLLNRFLAFMQSYMLAQPTLAQSCINRHQLVLQEMSSNYPEMVGLKLLLTGTAWLQTEEERDEKSVEFRTPTWLQHRLAPLSAHLDEGNPDEIISALQDLDNFSSKKPTVLDYFIDNLKKLMQNSNNSCRQAAFNLVVRHLKHKSGNGQQIVAAYLQCLEHEEPNVVLTALEHLPEIVILQQEFASVLLQKAFSVGISSGIDTAPHISESMLLLNIQSGC